MNYRTLIQKCCSIALTLVMVLNPAVASAEATSTSYYLQKAQENITLAVSTFVAEVQNNITATAESVKKETTELISKTRNAIVAEAESIKTETITLAQKTKDTAVAFKNDYVAHAVATADAVTGGAHSLIRSLTRTGDSILAYAASMSTLAAAPSTGSGQATPRAQIQTDTPTAFESAAGEGIALLKETTLLDSFARSFSTQLAATTLALPRFSLTADILSPSRNPVFHAFTHATARPVFASNNQPLPEPQPNTLVPARTTATTPANPIREPRASNGAGKLAQASPKADASAPTLRSEQVGSPTSSSVGAVTLTQSTPAPSTGSGQATPQVITSLGTVFEDILALRLNQLENKLASRIAALSASTNIQATQTYQVIAQTNKIDRLSSVSISGSTITGSSFAGSSMTADSSSLGNATSTTLFSTTASSTNLYSTAFTLGTGTLGSSTSTNSYSSTLTAGNATTTSLFSTTASSTNLYSQTAALGSTSISSALTVNGTFSVSGAFSQSDLATFTSGFLSNASSTITSGLFSMNGGASTTNFTASGIGYFSTATTTNLFSSSATSTNLFSTNFNLGTGTLGSATTTNAFSTTASSTNLFSQLATLGTLSAGATTLSSTLNLSGLGTLASGFLSTASSTITSGLFTMSGGASTTNLTASGTGYFGLGQFTNTSGTTTIASGQGFTVGSSQFVVQQGSGNVGINTAVPSYRLQINGNGTDSGAAAMSLNEGGVRQWLLGSGSVTSGNFSIQNMSTGASAFTINGTTNNIGVGTTTPGSQLSVTSGLSVGANYGAAAPSNGAIIEGSVGIGTTTPGSILSVQNVGNFVASATSTLYNGLQVPTFNATGLSTLANTIISSATSTNLFSTTASSTNLYAQAASVGTLAAGGAATLSSTLGVTGSTQLTSLTASGLTTLGNLSLTAGTTTNFFSTTASSTNLFSQLATLGSLTLGNALAVTSGGTGVTTSTGTGSVVLSASPTLSGTIAGASQTLSGTLGVTGLTTLGQASTTLFSSYGPAYFGATATSSFSNAGVLTLTGISNSLLAANGSGVVGATTTPTAQYFIATSTSIASTFPYASSTALTASGTGYFGLGQFTNTTGTTTIASGQGFTVGSSQLVVQQGSGNVGIGTTGPVSPLQVVGSFGTWGALLVGVPGTTVSTAITLGAGSNASSRTWQMLVGDAAEGDLAFRQSTTQTGSTFATKMTISAAGNVGIGTTGPNISGWTKALTVSNGAASSGDTGVEIVGYRTTNSDIGVLGFYNAASSNVQLASMQVNRSGADNSGDMLFTTTNAGVAGTKMTIQAAGNVGIGTTGPVNTGAGDTLVLDLTSSIPSIALHGTSGGSAQEINLATDGAGLYVDIMGHSTATNNNIIFRTEETNSQFTATERMRIDSSGNVGIGTTGPTAKLDVLSGTANTAGESITSNTARIVGPNVAVGTVSNNGGILNVVTNDALGADIGGSIGFGGRYTGTAEAHWAIIKGGKENATDGQYGGYLTFAVRAHGAVTYEAMRIQPNGNVGIGTTTPNRQLTLYPSTDASTGISFSGGTRGHIYLTGNDTDDNEYGVFQFVPSSGAGRFVFNSNSGADPAGSWLTDARMVIETSGNVGIGTTSPSYKLEVNGTTGLADDLVFTANKVIRRNTSDGSDTGSVTMQGGGDTVSSVTRGGTWGTWGNESTYPGYIFGQIGNAVGSRFQVYSPGAPGDGMALVVLGSNGNVGIGTTAPGSLLHVYGSVSDATPVATFENTHTTAFGTLGFFKGVSSNENNVMIGTAQSSNNATIIGWKHVSAGSTSNYSYWMNHGDSPGDGLVMADGGKIGIGTTTPETAKLSVQASVAGSVDIGRFLNPSSSTNNQTYIFIGQSLATGRSGAVGFLDNTDGASGAMFIGNYGDAVGTGLIVQKGGKVGIGTTAPDSIKLDVEDDIEIGTGTTGCVRDADNTTLVGTCVSDLALKKNIVPLPEGTLDKLAQLRPVTFEWRNDEFGWLNGQQGVNYGLIAQEVEQVFPEMVHTDDRGYKRVSYDIGLSMRMLEGIRELDARTSFISNSASSTVLTVNETGNVGIGTSTPQHRLQVAGDVAAEAFVNSSTRELKTDITGLGTTTEDSILEQLATTNVYSYRYKDEPATNPLRVGLIVDSAPSEVLSVNNDGVDIYKLAVFTLAGVKAQSRQIEALNLNLESIASSDSETGGDTPLESGEPLTGQASETQSFAERFFSNIFARITAWLADAANGVGDVLARTFRAKDQLCINDTCVNEEQLKALLAGAAASTGGVSSSSSDDVTTSTDAQPEAGSVPTISINGNNPATISVGDTFGDLGAIITGPTTADTNLGIYTFLDGVEMDTIILDTSTAGTHTIDYVATNSAGTATSTRTVIVEAPASVVVAEEEAPTDTTATSTDVVADSATATSTTP